MKKKLKKISLFAGLLSLCGAFGLSLFLLEHKKAESTYAVETSISNIEDYNYYSSLSGNFYFDDTYLTYDVGNNPNENRYNLRVYNGTPTDLTGLLYIFDNWSYFGGGNTVTVDFYSYYLDLNNHGAQVFSKFDKMTYGTEYIHYWNNNVDYLIHDSNGWSSLRSKQILFVSSGNSSLINYLNSRGTFYYFYEFTDFVSQVSTLQSQITSLESDISSLESQNSTLSSQVSTLQSQVNSLTTQLNNAVTTARETMYIVDVKCEYNLVFDAFINIENYYDFYIVPKRLSVNSRIDVFNGSGVLQESSYNLVDTFSFENLTTYYYSYNDLLNLLFINVNDSWLLEIPYYDNGDYSYITLDSINDYIDNWLYSYKSDISTTDNRYFRSAVADYCLILSDFISSSNTTFLDGYNYGYDDGFVNGKSEGYAKGLADGYSNGVEVNSAVYSIFTGILQVAMLPVNFFLAIFNFEILGINLSGFIRALFTIAITIIVIRTIFGGKGASDS